MAPGEGDNTECNEFFIEDTEQVNLCTTAPLHP
jgi:hypothetical protein